MKAVFLRAVVVREAGDVPCHRDSSAHQRELKMSSSGPPSGPQSPAPVKRLRARGRGGQDGPVRHRGHRAAGHSVCQPGRQATPRVRRVTPRKHVAAEVELETPRRDGDAESGEGDVLLRILVLS